MSGTKEEKIMEKAPHLMYDFIVSHAFADGNKRIGFTLFLLFLLFNNINFNFNLSDYLTHAKFIQRIADLKARNRPNTKDILIWFNKNNKI